MLKTFSGVFFHFGLLWTGLINNPTEVSFYAEVSFFFTGASILANFEHSTGRIDLNSNYLKYHENESDSCEKYVS